MKRALVLVVLGVAGVLAAIAVGANQIGSPDRGGPAQSTSRAPAQRAGGAVATPTPRGPAPPAVASVSAVAVEAAPEVVGVTLGKDQKVVLVDPLTGKVTRTLDAGVPPGAMVLGPDKQSAWLFSAKPGENTISVIDMVKGERRDNRRLKEGAGPTGAAFSTDGSRAYVALAGGTESPPRPSAIAFVSVTGGQFGQIDVGRQTTGVQIRRGLQAMAVLPGQAGEDVLYAAAAGSGTVFVLDASSGASLAEIEVGGGPIAMASDPARQRLYVLLDTLNQIVAIDTNQRTVVNRLDLPAKPLDLVVGQDGSLFVVGGETDGQLWTIGPDLAGVSQPLALGGRPGGIALSANGQQLYVTNAANGGGLMILSTTGPTVQQTIKLGADPGAVVATQRMDRSATPTPAAKPTQTPTLVPSPTPLPEGTPPPEHLSSGVLSDTFLAGASVPVAMAFAADGRLFYNELKTGRIRVVQNGVLLPEPFYQFGVASQPETGLLGLALDPDFANNHYLYVFYTSVPGGGSESGGSNGPNQVVRLTDVANKGTDPQLILDLPSGPIHNAGTLRFGPDGKLYVALGDNDQGSNAQDLNSVAGKILRVNPDGSIPSDNPFAGQPGRQGAIWALGLRNPYSFDFHPVGHDMLAIENGPGDNDELDAIVKGGNYGWPPTGYKNKPGIIDPLAVMNPPIGPTGMTFYTGTQLADWTNDWFYCNYHQGQLRRVHLAPVSFDRIVFEEVVKQGCTLDVATGPDGALYYSDNKGIYRLRMPDATVLPAVQPAAASAATPAPTEAVAAGTRPEDRDINISMSEWNLGPSRTKVPAGKIRLVSENVGATAHALRVVGNGLDVSTESFGPAESRSLEIVLNAGTYQLMCPIAGHEQQGMKATLTVLAPP
jgi:glucose/arabinose dehydrogenase/plastocyanin